MFVVQTACSDFINLNDAMSERKDRERRNAARAELIGEVFAVGHYGGQAYIELVGNFFVDEAARNEAQYVDFALCQLCKLRCRRGFIGLCHGGVGVVFAVCHSG